MESHRSTKRRKLDNGSDTSPKTPSRSTPPKKVTRESGSGQRGSQRLSATTNGTANQSPAQEAWVKAKANSQASKGRRTGLSPAKANLVNGREHAKGEQPQRSMSNQHVPGTTTPKIKAGVLSLQKSSPVVTSSPPKSSAASGFFKQFHRPRVEPATVDTRLGQAEGKGVQINGVNGSRTRVTVDVADDSQNELKGSVTSKTTSAGGRPAGQRWTYAVKPKRTFEDEIRELAEAAREQAENEDEDSTTPGTQRRSGRARPQRQDQHESADTTPIANSAVKRSRKIPEQKGNSEGIVDQPKHVSETSTVSPGDAAEGVAVDDLQMTGAQFNHDEQTTTTTPTKPRKAPKSGSKAGQALIASPVLKDLNFTSVELDTIRIAVLEKLGGKRPVRVIGLEAQYAAVCSLITRTVAAGESNSMLVIGSRGSGKSALVEQALREQANADDFHVVRLNGFIHTDDKIALRDIWRQLGREMELEDDEDAPKNHADTLTTLLALLSHPAELGREQEQDQITKSVIFIIDEFDLFTHHPRQTLLYNLFDIAQSRKAPIAVLGLTTRIDVSEALEKRVKSRFSHRYVHLGMPKSYAAFVEACKAALTLTRRDLTEDERKILDASSPAHIESLKRPNDGKQSATDRWTAFVNGMLAYEPVQHHLRRHYHTTKSIRESHTSLLLPLSNMTSTEPVTGHDLLEHFNTYLLPSAMYSPDSKLTLLASLSTLQLALLICAARLTAIHNVESVPFAQAYEEYKVLASKAKLQATASGALAQGAGSRVWGKDVARDAWEVLAGHGLTMEDGNRGVRVDVALEEIGMSGLDLGGWERWCKQI